MRSGPGDATTFAREAVAAGADVVVAGGDGTVNEALQGLVGQRKTALTVLPGGPVNVWATALGAEERETDIAARRPGRDGWRTMTGRRPASLTPLA